MISNGDHTNLTCSNSLDFSNEAVTNPDFMLLLYHTIVTFWVDGMVKACYTF